MKVKKKEKLCSIGGCICGALSCTTMFIATFAAVLSLFGFQISLFIPSNNLLNLVLLGLLIISSVLIIYTTRFIPKARKLSIFGGTLAVATMMIMAISSDTTNIHSIHLNNPILLVGFWIGFGSLISSLYFAYKWMFIRIMSPFIFVIIFFSLLIGFTGADLFTSDISKTSVTGSIPKIILERNLFVWEASLKDYNNEENYFHVFQTDSTVLNIEHNIISGKVKLGVMDGIAKWVLIKEITNQDSSPLILNAKGSPGTWMVILSFENFSGSLKAEMKPQKQ